MKAIYISSNNILSPLGFNTAENISQISREKSGIKLQNIIGKTPSYAALIDNDYLNQVFKAEAICDIYDFNKLEKSLNPLKNFILPSGHPISSMCHIARTVCRRAERGIVLLNSQTRINEICIVFLNRLSDYLFVLSRVILVEKNRKEIYWK